MKYYYKGGLYEDITPLEEGLLSTLLKAGSDAALKGPGSVAAQINLCKTGQT